MARTKVCGVKRYMGMELPRDTHSAYRQRGALQYLEGEQGAKATAVASAQARDILREPGILQEVCKYLAGHSLYIALVCRAWKRCYEVAAAESELRLARREHEYGNIDQALHITLYKAAFASAATVRHAFMNGLNLSDRAVIRSAGKHGSLEALAEIYELNGIWDGTLTHGAAARGMHAFAFIHDRHKHVLPGPHYSIVVSQRIMAVPLSSTVLQSRALMLSFVQCGVAGELKLLQFLLLNNCPYDHEKLACAAARSGSVELLTWLVDKHVVLLQYIKSSIQGSKIATGTLVAAVEAGHLHMCKHLLQLQKHISLVAADRVAYAAARTRNEQLLQWLQTDSGLIVSEPALFEYAVEQQDLATVLWLEQGFKLPEDRYTGACFRPYRCGFVPVHLHFAAHSTCDT
jgi:hypothetical protein